MQCTGTRYWIFCTTQCKNLGVINGLKASYGPKEQSFLKQGSVSLQINVLGGLEVLRSLCLATKIQWSRFFLH